MKVKRRLVVCLGLALVLGCTGQEYEQPGVRPAANGDRGDVKLPDGRSQREAILKADHEKSLKDADELVRLSEELKSDLEKNDRYVLSVGTLKKLDDIEKVTRRIRGRMKRL